jgi:hypothetical protein
MLMRAQGYEEGVTAVYRTQRFASWLTALVPAVLVVVGVWLLATELTEPFVYVWFAIVVWLAFNAFFQTAREVRLSQEGTCEFRSWLRTVSVPAARIRSIRGRGNSITFKWDGGRMYVRQPLDGLVELINRLRELNPRIETRGL